MDKITKEKLDKYRKITEKALKIIKKSITKGREKQAEEIIEIAECYVSDSLHFEKKEHLVNAFACLNYAHGWIDCGARLKIFDVKDRKLFAV
jgi:hypothetical protein